MAGSRVRGPYASIRTEESLEVRLLPPDHMSAVHFVDISARTLLSHSKRTIAPSCNSRDRLVRNSPKAPCHASLNGLGYGLHAEMKSQSWSATATGFLSRASHKSTIHMEATSIAAGRLSEALQARASNHHRTSTDKPTTGSISRAWGGAAWFVSSSHRIRGCSSAPCITTGPLPRRAKLMCARCFQLRDRSH